MTSDARPATTSPTPNPVEALTRRLLGYVAAAGAVGWAGTYAVDEAGLLSLEADVYLVVAGWAVLLAAGALLARAGTTAPTVWRADAWRVWVAVSAVALCVNAVANTPALLPGDLFSLAQEYAYYHPWFAAYAIGYAATARYQPRSRLVGRTERRVYAAAALASLGFLVALFAVPVPDEYAILTGGLLNVVPPLVAVGVRRREPTSSEKETNRA